jgi:colanic acid biosynthesis protein WcaH
MRIPDPLYAEILRSMPIPCVDLLILDARDRILLVRRTNRPAKGEWWFPGGRVHHRELRVEAARRKLHEECGLAPLAIEELGTFDVIFEGDQAPGATHGISTVYRVRVAGADVRLDGQATEFAWRSAREWLDELGPSFVTAALHRHLDLAARGRQ